MAADFSSNETVSFAPSSFGIYNINCLFSTTLATDVSLLRVLNGLQCLLFLLLAFFDDAAGKYILPRIVVEERSSVLTVDTFEAHRGLTLLIVNKEAMMILWLLLWTYIGATTSVRVQLFTFMFGSLFLPASR